VKRNLSPSTKIHRYLSPQKNEIDAVEILLEKDSPEYEFESLGVQTFFKKDSIPEDLGKSDSWIEWGGAAKNNQEMLREIRGEGALYFAGRPSVPVFLTTDYDTIKQLLPPPKPGMVRLYKATNLSRAVSILREGVFSTPIQPNLSEELGGEVEVAIDGYRENFGDKSYSVLLVIDCPKEEYEDQGGYEKFGVARKEFTGNTERLPYLGAHTRHIPAERITQCIFIESEPRK
jgi:hypothetical protein